MDNFYVNFHASICLQCNVYVDPFKIQGEPHNARAVFITHPHYDHLSIEDIKKVSNSDTYFVGTEDSIIKIKQAGISGHMTTVLAGKMFRLFEDTKVKVFPSYNINKPFHVKKWVGYIIEINGTKYAVCGDTDSTPELERIKCDVLFIPIGGTYTMDAVEAAQCANIIEPKVAVPIHYGNEIVGSKNDAEVFLDNLNKKIECKIF